jgi:purine-nucleoside phosphorylase
MKRESGVLNRLRETAEFLEQTWGPAPHVGLVLGSGLGGLAPSGGERLPFCRVPHYSPPSVTGHAGEVVLDRTSGLVCLSGRLHAYEGLPLAEVVFPVEALALWGVELFLLTNAAGGINVDLMPGDLMLIADHINLMGESPLAGPPLAELGGRFVDLGDAYCKKLRKLARRCAGEVGVPLKQGVYAALRGPNYETPAEIRMLRLLGADAVGMSTVPEVIALRRMRRRVLAFSCITNLAAGTLSTVLNHTDVLQCAEASQVHLGRLTGRVVESLRTQPEGGF